MSKAIRVSMAMLWALACSMLALAVHADVAVPPLTSRVTDLTGTLASNEKASLEQTLANFEQRKGSQFAVLIVATTAPEVIEQYSIRVAETWKIGRKGVDDGVLMVIAKDDRAIRIETGYGIEGVVTDAHSSRIIREYMIPAFRSGNFYGGITTAVERIIQLIDGEPLPPPTNRTRDRSNGGGNGIGQALPFLLVMAFVVGGVMRSIFGRLGGALLTGGAAGFIGWLMLKALPLALIFAVIGFVATLFGNNRRGGFGGGFGGGGWSGGGGGGGWSGGGGGFGGGGASGRW